MVHLVWFIANEVVVKLAGKKIECYGIVLGLSRARERAFMLQRWKSFLIVVIVCIEQNNGVKAF